MEKIKHYIDCFIPVTYCTLRCHYCYITHHRLFERKPVVMPYSVETVRKAMSRERLGGTCLLNFCAAGETMIADKLLDYVYALLQEGHYAMIVTNGTVTKQLRKILEWPPEILSRLSFKFSYHYLELKSRGILDMFFANARMMHQAGCSITVEVTPSDELIPYVDECIDLCVREMGAKPHLTIARDERDPSKLPILTSMPREEYYRFWGGKFESPLFDFKSTIFEVPRHEFCYAGMYSAYLNMETGMLTQCYKSNFAQNIFDDPLKPIKWIPIGRCLEHHCYNGHVWLTLGDIPDIDVDLPTYAHERNRVCADGTEWLHPRMKAFMSTRMYDSNPRLSAASKLYYRALNRYLWLDARKGAIVGAIKGLFRGSKD